LDTVVPNFVIKDYAKEERDGNSGFQDNTPLLMSKS
jgi:hypothetical protein